MSGLAADLRFALRIFVKNPGATAVAVLSLALAIGPNSTLFSVVDRFLLQPPPLTGLSRIYRVSLPTSVPDQWEYPSYPDYLAYCADAGDVAGFLAAERRGVLLRNGGRTEMVLMNLVSENYFELLGTRAVAGRLLASTDSRFEGPPPVVISYPLWQTKFNGAADVIGSKVILNGQPFSVAGVAPRDFRGPDSLLMPVDLWMPLSAADIREPGEHARMMDRRRQGISVIAVVHEGVAKARAEASLTRVVQRLTREFPGTNHGRAAILSLAFDPDKPLLPLMVLSLLGLVLLIACANVTGILLSQGEARRHEFAMRMALGASRGRLIRQIVVECLLLALAGAALGMLLAAWLIRALPALQPAMPMTINLDLRLDDRVALYTLLLGLLAALAAGLAPALRVSRPEPPRVRSRLRGSLIVAQIAFAEFLLAGAGLLVHSYLELRQIRPGFDPDGNVLVVHLIPGGPSADYSAVLAGVAATPGVRSVSSIREMPFSGAGGALHKIARPGRASESVNAGLAAVGPQFFTTIGMHILQGRDFRPGERGASLVVNETLARQLFGSAGAAVGRFVQVDDKDYSVVGVAENGKYQSLVENPLPYAYHLSGGETLLVATAGAPAGMASSVRKAIAAAAPGIEINRVLTLREQMRLSLFGWQMAAGLIGIAAVLGIGLAAVGLYGIVAYGVERRSHEIAVRMAVGARPGDVWKLVVRTAAVMVAIGTAFGLAGAAAAARAVTALLYHVDPADPAAILFAVLAVAAATLLATHVPARRALRLDPMALLRRE